MDQQVDVIGTTPVQNWMVWLAVRAVSVLGAGAVFTLVSVVNWCFWMQHQQGEMKREMAEHRVKAEDFNHAIGSLTSEVRAGFKASAIETQQLQRDVEVIKTKLERMP